MTYVLVEENTFEEEIKKSRFIAIAQPVSSAREAMAFFEQRSIAEARHNCWAYKVGEEYRFSDDGEPAGTAGRPILQAIEGQSCDYVAVLVIRWFGGIKLGTGGLARAYGGVTAECLRTAKKRKYVPTIVIAAFCPYAEIERMKARFDEFAIHAEQEDFGAEGVHWQLRLPKQKVADFEALLKNMSSGQGWVKGPA